MLESDIKIHSTVFMDISIDGADAAVENDGAAISLLRWFISISL